MGALVVLGDSISYGIGSSHILASYAARLGANLVIAKPGWTSARLFKEVKKHPTKMWSEVDTVIILIGGNDLLKALPFLLSEKTREKALQKALKEYKDTLGDLLRWIRDHYQERILVGTLYNPLPEAPFAKRCVMLINKVIAEKAKQFQAELVDLYQPFVGNEAVWIDHYKNGQLRDLTVFRDNPIHPNDAGHLVIANQFKQRLDITNGIQKTPRTLKKKIKKRRPPKVTKKRV